MKVIELNKVISNLKFINVSREVGFNKLLISPPHMIWRQTFQFLPLNHLLLGSGKHFFFLIFFLKK
jgi:hypothetical protein